MKKIFIPMALMAFIGSTTAQNSYKQLPATNVLPVTLKYVDTNNDDVISIWEAKKIFDKYRDNKNKGLENDLVSEVESTVIELISYLEGIDCNDIKKSIASKRFIEVYYQNKFVAPKQTQAVVDADTVKTPVFDFPESIVTDRPDQTEAPALTPPGFFQIEIGAQSEFDTDKTNDISSQSTLYNTTLWKYGVTKHFELRLITEFAEDKFHYGSSSGILDTTFKLNGFNPIAVGSKIHLQSEKGIVPEISLITHLELPYFGSKNYKPNYVIPRFRFLFAHTLSDRFAFSYNLGAEWEDGTNAATGIYTASFAASIIGNLSGFVEVYGFLKENATADHRFDGGLTYLITPNIQVDCSGGVGLTESAPDYFLSAGLSFRFNAFNRSYREANRKKNIH